MEAKELEALKQASPILQVAVELGIKVRSNMGLCFRSRRHLGGNTYSLFFNPAKNTFFCKECDDVGGDVIDLVCQYNNWGREQAIEWLRHRRDFDLETRDKYYHRGRDRGSRDREPK